MIYTWTKIGDYLSLLGLLSEPKRLICLLNVLLVNTCILAVLITGGANQDTAELFLPSDRTSCTLPSLPQYRYRHTLDNHILCGGYDTSDTCLQWSPDTGTWEELPTLDAERVGHVSWTPATGTGTYLIGGSIGGMTTTLFRSEGGQETGFPLKYDTE